MHKRKKILIVDDERKITDILKKVLSARGYEVEVSYNGIEALEKIKKFKPDLIIADIAMPEMDGYELCRRIRKDTDLYATRFIFLTAKNAREDEIKALGVGADDYITKPFDMEKLLARVEARMRWIEKSDERVTNDGVFEGGLSGKNLIDVLQILAMGQKTGILEIQGEAKGAIYLKDGFIVHAEVGNVKGRNAVYRILSMEKGRFKFVPSGVEEDRERIQVSSIILEWSKLWDESKKDAEERGEKISYEAFVEYMRKRTKEKG